MRIGTVGAFFSQKCRKAPLVLFGESYKQADGTAALFIRFAKSYKQRALRGNPNKKRPQPCIVVAGSEPVYSVDRYRLPAQQVRPRVGAARIVLGDAEARLGGANGREMRLSLCRR